MSAAAGGLAAPLATPLEQAHARVMFVGACVLALPAAIMTVYSLLLIYLVIPVLVTGGLNWGGWWLAVNFFRRGWHRPLRRQPKTVWLVSAFFNGLPFLGVALWLLSSGGRGIEGSWEQAGFFAYLAWMLYATVISIVLYFEQPGIAPVPSPEVAR